MRLVCKWIAAVALIFGVVGATGFVSPAHAVVAQFPDPDDFTDPVTGEFDVEAYLAALNAQSGQGGGAGAGGAPLARTGSSSSDIAAVGVGLVVVGAFAVVASRRRASTDRVLV